MKNLMIAPKKYFFDKNGLPLAFGKVYTYQAGTLINKATYNSEAGDVANANPIILNSEGYADIFLDGSYDFVVDDADDANIWTAGPISSNVNEEWANCTEATYVSPTSFKLPGNLTGIFDVGRRVRIDNDVPTFAYAAILTSVFAASETTITVDDSVVAVGILEACASIVGSESTTDANKILSQDGTVVVDGGSDGSDATAQASILADDGTTVLDNGADGTDATIKASVLADDGSEILDPGTDGTDAVLNADVNGDVMGDVTGNADTATALGGATYEDGSIPADGDFLTGTIRFARIGKLVTVSWSGLTYAFGTSINMATALPASVRPPDNQNNVFRYDAAGVENVFIGVSGILNMSVDTIATGAPLATTSVVDGGVSYVLA